MVARKDTPVTTTASPIGITGSTGQLGGRVASRLATLGHHQRLLVRNPARAPQLPGAEIVQASYEDGSSMMASSGRRADAVPGVWLRVRPPGAALQCHRRSCCCRVERIVYTSFLAAAPQATFTHAREHFLTEQRIRSTGRRYTFLRPSFYLDKAPGWFSSEGFIRGPAGNGTISWVSRDDLADVTVAVLTTAGHDGASYDITGSQALTLAEAAEQFSRATGLPASYQPETLEEARASRARFNPSDWNSRPG